MTRISKGIHNFEASGDFDPNFQGIHNPIASPLARLAVFLGRISKVFTTKIRLHEERWRCFWAEFPRYSQLSTHELNPNNDVFDPNFQGIHNVKGTFDVYDLSVFDPNFQGIHNRKTESSFFFQGIHNAKQTHGKNQIHLLEWPYFVKKRLFLTRS